MRLQYFNANGKLRQKYAKPLLDMGWHAFGDLTPNLDREHFSTLTPNDVQILEWTDPAVADVGNETGECLMIEVGDSMHGMLDVGRAEAERVVELVRGIIVESARNTHNK